MRLEAEDWGRDYEDKYETIEWQAVCIDRNLTRCGTGI